MSTAQHQPAKEEGEGGPDTRWMALALGEARAAMAAGEVPVGAVLVKNGQLLASGRNAPVADHDPTAHAEIAALRAGARALGNYRLDGCELFVTLEPCAMCAGAMLHARLARVVYGAADPRTGAAGSVVDLFARPELNHQTRVQGGVLAAECAGVLQDFFRSRREDARAQAQPLRDDALRTSESAFAALDPSPWQEQHVADLSALQGLRMSYVDTGADSDSGVACVCVHGAGAWNHQMRPVLQALQAAGAGRLLAPDLIGFGRSDKPKRESVHSVNWHRDVLRQWLDRLGVQRAVLVVAQSMQALGDELAAADPARIAAVLVAHERPGAQGPQDEAAWRAPFPDRGFEAALRAFGRPRSARHIAHEEARALADRAMGYFKPT